jgi:hypothetical protein
MNDHDFEVKERQQLDLPDVLKKKPSLEEPRRLGQDKAFNKNIHVDLIVTQTESGQAPGKTIISITDDSKNFCTSAVIPDSGIDSTISAIWNYWCQPYGFPETIHFKQGKVQTSKLESKINDLIPLKHKISCRSRTSTFNPEKEQQWRQNQNEISEEEFVHTMNFLCKLQNPARTRPSDNNQAHFDGNYDDLADIKDFTGNQNDAEEGYEELSRMDDKSFRHLNKRKHVSLCRHKLQSRAHGQSRCWRQAVDQQPGLPELEEGDTDHEWAQLKQMEKLIE